MTVKIDHTNLHRTAKYFMDSGRAASAEAAMDMLQGFGLTILVGGNLSASALHQTALLTLVNTARRTLLAGVEVVGLADCNCLSPLAEGSLADAVTSLGGRIGDAPRNDWPMALIGDVAPVCDASASWRVTWEGWRAGVTPARFNQRLNEDSAIAIAPALAAAACAAEVFSFHAGDHQMAGRRSLGLSLWQPGADWLANDASEPALTYLPSSLWLVGLGNLGQAFAWLLGCLPYANRKDVEFVLQDFDRIGPSNDSTSLLSVSEDVEQRKTRVVSEWLETRGFTTTLEERRFGPATRRAHDEPTVALFGVDNAEARSHLEEAGFDLVVEAGLGGGPTAFRSFVLHTFPGSRTAKDIWSRDAGADTPSVEAMPAYQALKASRADACGLTLLASRAVGVPFVGLIAACLAISELLRRLHGGAAFEFAAGSAVALDTLETGLSAPVAYGHGYVGVKGAE